jgi:hypothetical protein
LALAAQLREPAGAPDPRAAAPEAGAVTATATVEPASAPTPTRVAPTSATSAADDAERRRIRNIFIAIGAAVVIVGFLLLRACTDTTPPARTTATPTPTGQHTPHVTVRASDYLGRPFDEVRRALQHKHLRVHRIVGSATAPAGTVTGVDPTGSVKEGATVTVTVAATPTPTRPSPPKKHGPGHGKKKHGHDH